MQSCLEYDRLWRDYVDARTLFCALLGAKNPAVSQVTIVREQYGLFRSALRTHFSRCPMSTVKGTAEPRRGG